ncbi:MAG: endonuclease V [Pseudopedobacter saltans]|uniref:Endonuclease V n=1 Tax=Pseudopedobacter saltans TaxID=151895 RepID=A0A2W5GRH6_9SPHI|nr:MAG: endonuclease V [Pseudopedobacter saltans]
MILCFDTYYIGDKAKTISLAFTEWESFSGFEIFSEMKEGVAEYVPGEFYKRELPCILSLLSKINIDRIEAIVVDGFVYLNDIGKLGLGGYLYKELDGKIPVIGVAKTDFLSLVHYKRELLRGSSKNPLYITAIGMDLDVATQFVKSMHGDFRMPTLLKELDRLTKEKDG